MLKDRIDVAALGLEMGAAVGIGWLVGSWVDRTWDVAPWGTWLFLVAGFGAAVKGFVRVYRKARRDMATPWDPTVELRRREGL